ncbi:MAG: hypothetical protein H6715_05430 [Myxococcales bacterium]|nr:hypothetical protein [Myxococcales bacterium]MCB9709425.1 hypothetical protein [Myxococcales bacterium]
MPNHKNTLRVVVLSSSDDSNERLIAEAIADAMLVGNPKGGPGSAVAAAPQSLAEGILLEADAALVLDAPSLRQALEAGVAMCAVVLPSFDVMWPGSLSEADCVYVVHETLIPEVLNRGAKKEHVHVIGPIAPKRFSHVKDDVRSAREAEFGLVETTPIVLVPTSGLDAMDLGMALTQLAQVKSNVQFLFDVDDDVQAAEALRREVPGRGIQGRMFADRGRAPEYWQLAQVVMTRPRSTDVLKALAVGAGLVLPKPGRGDGQAAKLLCEIGVAHAVNQDMAIASTIETAIAPAAIERTRRHIEALDMQSGARRLAEHIRLRWDGGFGKAASSQRPRGLPKGLEAL